MKTKTQIAVVLIILGSLISGLSAGDYKKKLYVNKYSQKNSAWCAIATVAMWTDWLENPKVKNNQLAIAKEAYGSKAESPDRGMGTRQMADVLEEFSNNWFSSYNTTSQNRFLYKIASSLNYGRPVAIPIATRYTGGYSYSNGHYVLITGYETSNKKYKVWSKYIKGFYVNDPAYDFANNKPLYKKIKAQNPYEIVTKKELFSDFVSNSYKGRYYMVLD